MEANMQVLEGAQYRLRVKLTNEAGSQLPPELFRVYAGAFCPGYAPAHFHAERTAEEWVLTMPGLKPGRVPWNWQVIAAEYATGVEWLLAAGEVTVTPRHATGSGCVDPGELKIVATLDKTTLQMTVQVGESTSACSLAVVDARQSAAAAAASAQASATSAGESAASASAAADSAHEADGRADDASASAADAQTYAGQAAGCVTEAAEYAAEAATSATAAANSAVDADRHSADAAASVAMAAGSASEAAGHASAAAGSATAAANSATEAATSSHAAANSAEEAAASAGEAATSSHAAANSAEEAAASAGEAATSAEEAADSAEEAAASATAAAESATDASAVLEGAAQVGGNNTFTGTNTFNGQLTANGDVSVPEPSTGASPVRQDIAHLYGFVTQNSLVQRNDFELSLKSAASTGTVTPEGNRVNVKINDEAATLIIPSYQVIKGVSGVTVAAARCDVGTLYEHQNQYSALGGVFLKLETGAANNYTVACAPNTYKDSACKIPLNIEAPLINAIEAEQFYRGHTWYFEVNVFSSSSECTIKLRYPDKIDSVKCIVETTSTINMSNLGSVVGIFSIAKSPNLASVFLAMRFNSYRGMCYFYIGDVYAPSTTWKVSMRSQDLVIAVNARSTVVYHGSSWLPMLDGHWFGNLANILQAKMPNTQETTRYTLDDWLALYPADMYAGTIEY